MLPLAEVVLLAGIQGLSEALPVSRSAHDVVARLFLDPGAGAASLERILHLATAAALFVGARGRLSSAVSEGLRAVSRPSLFATSPGARDASVLAVAATVSLLARAIVRPFVELWQDAPLAVGFGLVLSGLIVATTSLLPRGREEAPALPMAALLGLVHATGCLPGGSDLCAALAASLAMGMKWDRALDLSLSLTGVTLLASFVSGLSGLEVSPSGAGMVALGLVTAFLGATVAALATRHLLANRALSWLAFWILPLGFATVSYARTLS